MVENRRLLIALAVVFLVGIVARFTLTSVALQADPYYVGVPDETPSFRAVEVYVCPECTAAFYDAYKSRMLDEEARQVLQKYRLQYEEPGENGCCPNHPDQKLTKTAEIPVHPQVTFGLPEDTEYIIRAYLPKNTRRDRATGPIELTIVISSTDRRSIHRAESCLNAQGWTMQTQGTVTLKCKGVPGNKLSVRSLLMETFRGGRRGETVRVERMVLYWYAALPDRVTSSEYRRLATMFYDRLVRGANYRWSYVLVSKRLQPGESPAAASRELEQFVKEFAELAQKGEVTD